MTIPCGGSLVKIDNPSNEVPDKSQIVNRKWRDGPHMIGEYDGNNNLLRKYIYGPGICVAFTLGFNRICSKFRFKAGMC